MPVPTDVYVAHSVAERCDLGEALLWIIVNRLPLLLLTEHDVDIRVDDEFIEGLDRHPVDDAPLSDEECKRLGLPTNPERAAYESGQYHSSPETIKKILTLDLPIEQRRDLERDLIAAKEHVALQSTWDAEFDTYADLHKTRLFLALREGRLVADGRQLPRATIEESLAFLEDTNWEGWDDIAWTPIPADFWISNTINWLDSHAEGRTTSYCLILVRFDQLYELFPAVTEREETALKVGDAYLLETKIGVAAGRRVARGRPSFAWDEFHLEVARRLHRDAIPAKQDAFIADMQEWCRATWKKDVGRSTILQKVKPYYDTFYRKSEKA